MSSSHSAGPTNGEGFDVVLRSGARRELGFQELEEVIESISERPATRKLSYFSLSLFRSFGTEGDVLETRFPIINTSLLGTNMHVR